MVGDQGAAAHDGERHAICGIEGNATSEKQDNKILSFIMTLIPILAMTPLFAAAGYSLVYLLAGGGLGGAILIFIVAKMLGK
jgi:hypothetical protein